MQRVKIKNLGKIITGKTPSTKKPELFGDAYPFITPSDISSYDVYHIQGTERGLSEEGYLSQKSKLLPPRTVCYVCIGSTVGKICLTKESSFTNQQLNNIIVDQSRYVPEYIYYRLRYETPRIRSIAGGTGSGKAIYNKTAFEEHQLEIHDYPLQQKITFVLSSYDDLIENNTRRIKILQEMAQLIYQEWFVNFRFPGHEKARFENSELGNIPEEWEILRLGEVLESIESGSRPKGGIDPEQREVPSIGAENVLGLGRYDFGKEKYVSEEFYENMRKGKIQSGDVLLYKDGAKIGRKSMFRDGFPHEVCCINEHVFILRTNSKCSQNYLYFYLDRPDITEKIINLNANAAQPGINQAGVKSLPILLPPENLIRLFNDKVEPIIGLLFNLAKKNQILRKKRDLLLPKLISGELDISDLDIVVREQENDT